MRHAQNGSLDLVLELIDCHADVDLQDEVYIMYFWNSCSKRDKVQFSYWSTIIIYYCGQPSALVSLPLQWVHYSNIGFVVVTLSKCESGMWCYSRN